MERDLARCREAHQRSSRQQVIVEVHNLIANDYTKSSVHY